MKQESTISSSQEASCTDISEHDRNADHDSKADKGPEYPIVENVGTVDIGAEGEGRDSDFLAALDGIEAEDVDPALMRSFPPGD